MDQDQFPFEPTEIEDADTLISQLSDPDPRKVAAAAFGLSWHDDPRKTEPLLKLLEHSDEGVRQAATMGLSRILTGQVEHILIRLAASDPASGVRASAVSALTYGSKHALAAIANAADDSDPDVRVQVALAFMWRRGRLGRRILRRLLDDPNWKVRRTACSALLLHKAVDTRLINTIERLTHEPEAAEHDARAIATRETLQQRQQSGEAGPHMADIISQMRTMQETLEHARELLHNRRGIWRFVRI